MKFSVIIQLLSASCAFAAAVPAPLVGRAAVANEKDKRDGHYRFDADVCWLKKRGDKRANHLVGLGIAVCSD
ncbi:hypothetical protein B0T18DRAFT_432644 [Schizothecium vesticola]|uniref:Uncharacterized protein n=1 Tax=Schizothecium vesticola TaxID=314040 RepID=A0AA40ELI2_9PEZI|nr:hypothetical protein B0T18DRAFT_432644 [Schizothecium vesticola]